MSTSPATADMIASKLANAGEVTVKKMFGEYGVFCDGKMVALICDDMFYVKPTEAGKTFWGPCEEASPYKGAKPCMLMSDADLQNKAKLVKLIRITWEHLPLPAKKAPKKKK